MYGIFEASTKGKTANAPDTPKKTEQIQAIRDTYSSGKNVKLLPFDDLTEKGGLAPLLKKFKKLKCNVVEVDAKNKPKRESGILLKNFTLKFDDGQELLVRVKSDGTVFQVKLNKKVIPVRNVTDIDKAVAEIVGYVQDNAEAYEKAKLQREKRAVKPKIPKVTVTRKQQIDQLQQSFDRIKQENQNLDNNYKAKSADELDKKAQLALLEKDLKTELEKTDWLNSEIDKLEKELQKLDTAA